MCLLYAAHLRTQGGKNDRKGGFRIDIEGNWIAWILSIMKKRTDITEQIVSKYIFKLAITIMFG